MSYVYVRSEPGLFTVGHYSPDGRWHPDGDYSSRDEAAARVHYLNGGTEPDEPSGAPGDPSEPGHPDNPRSHY
jgi:hypothetical protein